MQTNGISVRTEPKKTKVSETFMSENFQIEENVFFWKGVNAQIKALTS